MLVDKCLIYTQRGNILQNKNVQTSKENENLCKVNWDTEPELAILQAMNFIFHNIELLNCIWCM